MDVEQTHQMSQDDQPTASPTETPQLELHQNTTSKGKDPYQKRKNLLSTILIVGGLLLIVVPPVLKAINTGRNEDLIDEYLKQSEHAISDTDLMHDEDVEAFYIPEVMIPEGDITPESTNATGAGLSGEEATPASVDSAQAGNTSSSPPGPTKKPLMSKEEIKKRMTGVLIIDKIDLRMVIMDGVDEETLRVAAGRMPNTGKFDEIGNIVLAGHRSYTLGKYFNRLDELEPGDQIVIQTSKKTLTYEIYKKLIVEPDDFSITNQNDTDKILTLFTCHPVVIASHRLVVHAKQME